MIATAQSGIPLAVAAPRSISIRGVSKHYGDFVALNDVSLEVKPGEFLTLLGPSGSGKTTLLNIISGFIRLDSGQVHFGDENVTLRPVNRRDLGMVFQNYALFPHMTVGENVAFPLRVRRMGNSEIGERVAWALRLVRMEQLAERSVGALSGGQRQRVALARAVVFSPQIVLMDEPLSALDKNLREEMQVEIRHLHEHIGSTTVYVTHDQREALTMSDRIAVMNGGRIVQCDTPPAIYEHPRTAFVAQFIGETTLIEVTRHGDAVALSDGSVLRTASVVPAAGRLFVAIRAERVLSTAECGPGASQFPVTVRDVIYHGDSLLILAELDGHDIAMRRPLRTGSRAHWPAPPAAGERLMVGLDPESVVVVAEE